MLVIVIFALLAAMSFRRILREKGYRESKAWFFPILSGSLILVFAYALNLLSAFWIRDPESGMARAYPFVVSFLALLVHALVVTRAWKQLKALPERGGDESKIADD